MTESRMMMPEGGGICSSLVKPLGLTHRDIAIRSGGVVKLDALDEVIIHLLQGDGAISLRNLARRAHSSEATVRRRVERLRKNDVMRIVAVVDPFKQGFSVVAIFNLKIDQRRMREVQDALAKRKELRFVGVTIGAYDMVSEAWFRSTTEMLQFTSEVLARIPGILRIETLQILEMIKYTYDWGKSHAQENGAETID
jgi:Lrp/AsnC family transcriptional regulator for asnA, asnC and gidA